MEDASLSGLEQQNQAAGCLDLEMGSHGDKNEIVAGGQQARTIA